MSTPTTPTTKALPPQHALGGLDRGARILARSFYRDLRVNGYSPEQILALSTELIELITQEMRDAKEPGPKGEA